MTDGVTLDPVDTADVMIVFDNSIGIVLPFLL